MIRPWWRMAGWPAVFIASLAVLRFIRLVPVGDEFWAFGGLFHVIRLLRGIDHQQLSAYLEQAWAYAEGDPANLPVYHWYHVKFAWGFVYPLLATLYAVFAETVRHCLGSEANYALVLVRVGNAALLAHWAIVVAAAAWALQRIDGAWRPAIAAAAAAIVWFDYVCGVNYAVAFHGHPVLGYLHEGFVYAATLWAPRSAVSLVLGLYLAARLLDAGTKRVWIIPLAFVFHLASATVGCAALFAAEALWCAVKRRVTPDARMLAAATAAGLGATLLVGSSGHAGASAGILPGGVLRLLIVHVLTHAAPPVLVVGSAAALLLGLGLAAARRADDDGVSLALLVSSVMAGLFALQLATGSAVAAGVLTWHNNASVHSLLYVFSYSSSAAAFGLTVWLAVTAGKQLSFAAGGRIGPAAGAGASALAAMGLLFVAGLATAGRPLGRLRLWPVEPVGEPIRQLAEPARWLTIYREFGGGEAAEPELPFAERSLPVRANYVFTSLVYLRALHQTAVWGGTGDEGSGRD